MRSNSDGAVRLRATCRACRKRNVGGPPFALEYIRKCEAPAHLLEERHGRSVASRVSGSRRFLR